MLNNIRRRLFLLTAILFLQISAFAVGPTITSLSQSAEAVGAGLTIVGSGFGNSQGSSRVLFNGTAASVSSWTSSNIQTVVPAGATSGPVTVVVSGRTSNGIAFTVLPTPTLSSMSPTAGPPGTVITLTGNNFGTTLGSVLFANGVSGPVSNWSTGSITATVPTSATGGNVVVQASGVTTSGINFTVWPTIQTVTPGYGNIGATVTISGLNFGDTQGNSSVSFSGVPASSVTSWSSTSITALVPTGASTGNIVVTVNQGPSNGSFFIVGSLSQIVWHLDQGYNPNTGTDLLIRTTPTAPYTFVSSQDIKGTTSGVTVKAFSSTTGLLGTIPQSATISATLWMKETAAITGIYPQVTISTSNGGPIYPVCTATGTSALTTTLTKYQLSCTAPTTISLSNSDVFWVYAAATWSISIKQSDMIQVYFDGTSSAYDSFATISELLYPSITSISPSVGSMGGQVTINGASFGATQGNGAVTFGGVAATVSSWSDSQIVVTAPCAVGAVIVSTGGVPSNSVPFSALMPVISTPPPVIGPAGGSITISGSYLSQPPCATTAIFSGTVSSPTSVSPNQLVVPVPSTSTQPGALVVNVGPVASVPVQFVPQGGVRGSVTAAIGGAPVSGATVQLLQGNSVVASSTSAQDGSYSVNAAVGTYDVRFQASGFGITLVPTASVAYGAFTTVNAALGTSGTISGQVTQSDGLTPIAGAQVTAAAGSSSVLSATSDSNGNYSISNLGAGTYSVVAAATGFTPQIVGSVTVTAGGTPTANFSLQSAPSESVISYAYDELDRLIGASDSQGSTAQYAYDAAGNMLSITVNPSSQTSIIGFDPIHGSAGTTVTISGTAFSSTPSQNTVKFNGTTANVVSASSNQLVVTVPSGATTGVIQVTAPSGTATSGSSFSIP